MSWLKLSGAVLAALFISTAAVAAQGAGHFRHSHPHGRHLSVGPEYDLYGPAPPPAAYEPSSGYYPGGQLYTRDSGGVNSLSNNFGTSGVLGHTNGMPANSP